MSKAIEELILSTKYIDNNHSYVLDELQRRNDITTTSVRLRVVFHLITR